MLRCGRKQKRKRREKMATIDVYSYIQGSETAKEFMVGATQRFGIRTNRSEGHRDELPLVCSPLVKPYFERLEAAHRGLEALSNKTDEEITLEIDRKQEEYRARRAEIERRNQEENERADRLDAAIKAYDFPERLTLYRDTLLESLRVAKNKPTQEMEYPKETVEEYRQRKQEFYEGMITRAEENIVKEVEQARENTEWVNDARAAIDEICKMAELESIKA